MTSPRESLPAALYGRDALGVEVPEWLPVSVSDWRLRRLRDDHYSGGVGGKTAGRPGRRIAFVTFEGTAGWISGHQGVVDHDFGDAFECTLFRKECAGLSSPMIEDAIWRTEARWGAPPPGGWLTFIDADKVKSPNPGYSFKCAGFVYVGKSKDRGLTVLRRGGSATIRLADRLRLEEQRLSGRGWQPRVSHGLPLFGDRQAKVVHHEGWAEIVPPHEAGWLDPPMQEWLALPVGDACPACGSTHWGTLNARGYFCVRQCHDEHATGCRSTFRGEVTPHTIESVVSALVGTPRRFATGAPRA